MPQESKSEVISQIPNVEINIQQLEIQSLVPFEHHPFHVSIDQDMIELIESISTHGIITPIIVRPLQKGIYQILSGHRRVEACKKLCIAKVPAIISRLSSDDATILMVDSNLNRMSLLPSEKAFSYRMRLEALKHRGIKRGEWINRYPNILAEAIGRRAKSPTTVDVAGTKLRHDGANISDDTSRHDGANISDSDLRHYGAAASIDISRILRSDEMLSALSADSARMIQRYIRLTYLIPTILDMVDAHALGFTPAVEISFLRPQEQELVYCVMQELSCTPSVLQARRLKELSQIQPLAENVIYATLKEEKPNQREKFYLQQSDIASYFPQNYSGEQMRNTILFLLKRWQSRRGGNADST